MCVKYVRVKILYEEKNYKDATRNMKKKRNKKRLEWKLMSMMKIQLICKKNDDIHFVERRRKKCE